MMDSSQSVANFCSDTAFITGVKDLLCQRTGIRIQQHQLGKLVQALRDTCRQFNHSQPQQLLDRIQSYTNSPEMEKIIAEITIGESFFFRDDSQITFLRDNWLPRIVEKRRDSGQKMLRIWSAGCSAGQELYTVAILLREMLPDINDWHTHLLGSDINTNALSQAVRGRYTRWSLRNTSDWIKEKYFINKDTTFQIHPDVKKPVNFTYLNLMEDGYPSVLTDTVALDLILCRNVFIYFDQARVQMVMQRFRHCLVPEGMIMLGASDLLEQAVPGLELYTSDSKGFNCYYHSMPDTLNTTSPNQSARLVTKKRNMVSGGMDLKQPDLIKNVLPSRQKKQGNTSDLSVLYSMCHNGKWQQLYEMIEGIRDHHEQTLFVTLQTWALANMGQLEEAEILSDNCVELNKTLPEAWFVRAMIKMDLEKLEEADLGLKRALFLNREFAEAHYQYGMLKFRHGQIQQGLKSLDNARKYLEPHNSDTNGSFILSNEDRQRLAETIRNEMMIYSGTAQIINKDKQIESGINNKSGSGEIQTQAST